MCVCVFSIVYFKLDAFHMCSQAFIASPNHWGYSLHYGSKLNTHCSGFVKIPKERDLAIFPTDTYPPLRATKVTIFAL